MANKVDLRDGFIVVGDSRRAQTISKTDVKLARNEADLLAKLTDDPLRVYYFNYDVLFDSWECVSGPKGLPRPQPSDWPSVQRNISTKGA